MLAVELRTKHMMAQSLGLYQEGIIDDADDILVKSSSKTESIWDEEW